MTNTPFTLRWGIISTGQIARDFTQDLLTDLSKRGATDIQHVVASVGSRSIASAQAFIDRLKQPTDQAWGYGVKVGGLDATRAYGSYAEVYADPDVDVIYIGTPVTHHHKDAKAALLAGKHVLCEKAFTFDVAELDELIAIAKEKGLFLMEAVWTRFHPISYAAQSVIASGVLGRPKRFAADFSIDFKVDNKPLSDRYLDPALGGGGLLDMGPYPSVWAMLLLYQHPDNHCTAPSVVNTYQKRYTKRGCNVDARSRWLLEFPALECEAALMTDMTCDNLAQAAAVLQCEDADLVIESPPQKPSTFHVIHHNGKVETHHVPVPPETGHGLHYEADEVARCIRDGRTESARMPLAESRIVQQWFDAVRMNGETALRDMVGTAGQ